MLTPEEVIKIAKLAKLVLTDQEVKKYQKELSSVLDYVEKLNEINTDQVKPLYQVTGLENIVRKDEVIEEKNTANFLDLSPQGQENNCFLVKNVL